MSRAVVEFHRRLRAGDRVECLVRGVLVRSPDESLYTVKGRPAVEIRPDNSRVPIRFALADVRRRWEFNTVTGNIYADWLEENGEPIAAAKLREAFPFPTD